MQIDKEEVVDLLRARGDHDKAASVECALPRRVDTEADAGVLHQFDVNISDIARLAGTHDDRGEPLARSASA